MQKHSWFLSQTYKKVWTTLQNLEQKHRKSILSTFCFLCINHIDWSCIVCFLYSCFFLANRMQNPPSTSETKNKKGHPYGTNRWIVTTITCPYGIAHKTNHTSQTINDKHMQEWHKREQYEKCSIEYSCTSIKKSISTFLSCVFFLASFIFSTFVQSVQNLSTKDFCRSCMRLGLSEKQKKNTHAGTTDAIVK